MNDKIFFKNGNISRKNYKSNVKIMKLEKDLKEQNMKDQAVEQTFNELMPSLDYLIQEVTNVVVLFDGFESDITEVSDEEYIHFKKQLLRSVDKTRLIISLLQDNVLKPLEDFDSDVDLDDRIYNSLESELDAKWDDIIDYINAFDGVSAKRDEFNSSMIGIYKDGEFKRHI